MIPSRATCRKTWLTLHRYSALALGWLLLVSALAGAVLTIAKPLDRWTHPELFVAPAAAGPSAPAPLQAAREVLAREFGAGAALTFRPPGVTGETLWVRVRAAWSGTVYFDPATALEVGRRGEHEGAYNTLFELHSALLAGEAGQAVLAIAAMAYLFLLATGLVLWWPARWPPTLRIRLDASALKALFDLHSVGGAMLGLLMAISVATGAYMAWPPLRTWVSSLAGEQPARIPGLGDAPAGGGPGLDALAAKAGAAFEGARVGFVSTRADASQPVRVRLKLPGDPHPVGMTSVWLHPGTGAVLAVQPWDQLDAGQRAVSVVYPLHTGELAGPVHTVVVAVTGLGLALLGGSGLWLWWLRRRSRIRVDAGEARRQGA